MKEHEKIDVFIRFEDGRTQCMCVRSCKGCDEPCQPDVVTRDKFRNWQQVMHRDRYGK